MYVLVHIFQELAKYHYRKGDIHSGMTLSCVKFFSYKLYSGLSRNRYCINLKDAVPISAKSSIKFVRKGAKVTRKKTPSVGILHHASQWILLADLNKNFCFPVHIAFTQLRPDITIF